MTSFNTKVHLWSLLTLLVLLFHVKSDCDQFISFHSKKCQTETSGNQRENEMFKIAVECFAPPEGAPPLMKQLFDCVFHCNKELVNSCIKSVEHEMSKRNITEAKFAIWFKEHEKAFNESCHKAKECLETRIASKKIS